MYTNIDTENRLIGDVTKIFNGIQQELESMTTISEEHAATTEEVFATSENQNSRIVEIASAIEKINMLSNELKKIIE
jgi:methyl-accepting chemotaxis protein